MAIALNDAAKKQIIQHLNKILKNELTAINQYFLHARMLQHQGYARLGDKEFHESVDEMKHADEITKRVLYLGGIPNLQDLGRLRIGEHVKEMMECDLAMEQGAIADLREAIAVCEEHRDFVSADLLHAILASEEEHHLWLSQQLRAIEDIGVANYLQSQLAA